MNAMQEQTPPHVPPYPQAAPVPPPMVRMRDSRSKSPAIAAMLSMMPGLGQVYVGYYQRGFVHALVIASLATILSSEKVEAAAPLFGLFMAFFWLYNVIDAARRASLYNDALAGNPSIELPADFRAPGFRGSIAGGITLIAAGFVLLLHTRFGVSLDWVEEWWPVAPMILGAYLLGRAILERRTSGPGGASAS
ncbi:MAG TPA: DUF5668 domain-containing protein [Candidatus Polarisedimenticolia bacterium]|nr:DUF5668 domain-containing protein [Candidatus Polarisedimenticolia bacterium]